MWQFAAAALGLNLVQGFDSAEQRYDQAQADIKSINKELKLINKQKNEYVNAFADQGRNIYDIAGNRIESLSNKIGLGFKENVFKTDNETSKSGLAFSGTVEQRSDLAKDVLNESFRSGRQSIMDDRAQALSTLNMQKTKLLNSLDLKQVELEGRKKVDKTENGFLGYKDWF